MGGAFQTSRDIFNNPIWQDIPKFRIFFCVVGNAVFSKEGVRMGSVVVERGQYLRSYRNLAEDLQYIENRKVKKYSISVISRKIDQLVKEDRLKIEDTELGTLFTVVNYELYQVLDSYKKTGLGTGLEQGWNTDGTELEQSGNNNKNVNKVKNEKKDNKKNSPKPVYDETSIPFQLASYFLERIRLNNPDHKQPNLQTWSNDIRLMMEADNKNEEQIRYLMKWVQEDNFERSNVLSPSKLRKRFDSLVMKVKSEREKKQPKKSIFTQGEESKKRQSNVIELNRIDKEQLQKWEEELPY